MEKRLNELLRHALSPTDEPDFWLNQRILNQVKEQKEMTGRKRRFSIAVMAAVIVLCLSSVTVYAAWKYLSAADVADKVQDTKLAEAFLSEEAMVINETRHYEGSNALFLLRKGEAKEDVQESGENVEPPGTDQNVMEVQLAEESPVAEYALQFVGNPYAWGGESLTEGADSSGFVKAVYAHFDIELPRSSTEQRKQGIEVDGLANAQPGDLIFYDTPAHVAIYVGEESIIHADPANGITVSGAEFDDISGIRRIIIEPGK